ncbi:hypothetical protein DL765_001371 [Monosporascus sp. GIB2]|nr:hypothetical protein DL765_001371 [Monosporascus sp. GIB2]
MGTTKKNKNSGSQASGSGKGAAAKGDAKKKDAEVVTGKPVKGAQRVEVRHILCVKYSKWEEAYKKLSENMTVGNFASVAREYNEDKPGKG